MGKQYQTSVLESVAEITNHFTQKNNVFRGENNTLRSRNSNTYLEYWNYWHSFTLSLNGISRIMEIRETVMHSTFNFVSSSVARGTFDAGTFNIFNFVSKGILILSFSKIWILKIL